MTVKCPKCGKPIASKFCPDCGVAGREELKKPETVKNPDLSQLKKICQQYIDAVASGNYCDDTNSDYKHYIFEEAITAFFGKDVFNYINK
jgi:hypothetical protein